MWNILNHFTENGTLEPFKRGVRRPTKMTNDVLLMCEIYKLKKLTIYENEIRGEVQAKEVFAMLFHWHGRIKSTLVNTLPRNKLDFTWKRISQIPRERDDAEVDDFLEMTWNLDAKNLKYDSLF